MSKAPSKIRVAVIATLRAATIEFPLTSHDVAKACGITLGLARQHIAQLKSASKIINIGRNKTSAYAWRGPAQVPAIESRITGHTYKGEPSTPRRPGAMDAFTLPSLQGNERVERVRPAIISGKALEVVGMWAGQRA